MNENKQNYEIKSPFCPKCNTLYTLKKDNQGYYCLCEKCGLTTTFSLVEDYNYKQGKTNE